MLFRRRLTSPHRSLCGVRLDNDLRYFLLYEVMRYYQCYGKEMSTCQLKRLNYATGKDWTSLTEREILFSFHFLLPTWRWIIYNELSYKLLPSPGQWKQDNRGRSAGDDTSQDSLLHSTSKLSLWSWWRLNVFWFDKGHIMVNSVRLFVNRAGCPKIDCIKVKYLLFCFQ